MLWSDFNISTVLDIPCGDFYWMNHVQMDDICGHGADIVRNSFNRTTSSMSARMSRFAR